MAKMIFVNLPVTDVATGCTRLFLDPAQAPVELECSMVPLSFGRP
jgi:hypothetical protein